MTQVRMAFGIAATLLLVAACGQAPSKPTSAIVSPVTTPTANAAATVSASPTAVPSPSPIASATPTAKPSPAATPKVSPTLLFAVLEAKGTANAWTYNTVAIAGLDGYARAKTTFTPMPVPALGCMGAIIPPSAQVAAGKVYFADAHGVVRSLSIDNKVTIAATFPMTSTQQILSFAVSPDGSQIVGTLFTAPKAPNLGCSGTSSGTFTFDAYRATSPTTNDLVYHQAWSSYPPSIMALTGWDSLGPLGTYPTVWASQGGGPSSTLGIFVRIDATTLKPGAQFSDPGKCLVWSSIQSGSFVCTKDPVMVNGGTASQTVTQPLSVRRADGTETWTTTVVGQNGPFNPFLSPDGQRVVICCDDRSIANANEWLVGRDGARADLAAGFGASGWLDPTTVVGALGSNIAYVALNSPSVGVSMGFTGLFVGTVRA